MQQNHASTKWHISPANRIKIWYWLLLVIVSVCIVRLFYVQVIRHDYYSNKANVTQLKEYEILADRGVIEAQNGDGTVPIVLNHELYTLYADPIYVKEPSEAADAIASIIGGDAEQYESKLKSEDTRYVVLATKLDKDKNSRLGELDFKGIGTRGNSYRTYPQGTLAAQILGFVNDEGEGKYGLEQALNEELSGTPGRVKAITDVRGVPLAGNDDNIAIDPVPGKRTVLSIDVGMQSKLEAILKKRVTSVNSTTGSALIIETKTGKVKAMAAYPTYDPEKFFEVEGVNVFENGIASSALEVGSIMKPLTLAATLDQGLVNRDTTFYDPGFFNIDNATVRNVEEVAGSGTRPIGDTLRLSLNTGATWLLMQMGGGEVNERARLIWHEYMTKHYGFGSPTGIEQGFEATGYVPSPTEGFGLDIQFANTSFGQGVNITPLQMATALVSIVNGGTYYQPQLVAGAFNENGDYVPKDPVVKNDGVISDSASADIRALMEYAFTNNYASYGLSQLPAGYRIGGKTGTAEVPNLETGGYYEDRYNGTFMGFVGGDEPEYVVLSYVKEPKVSGYAGTEAAAPIFTDLVTMLINDFSVTPTRN